MALIQSRFIQSALIHGGGNPAAGITSIVQQASATSSTDSVTVPSVNAGDVMVLLDYAVQSGGEPTTVVPSGWTQMLAYGGDVAVSGFRSNMVVSYRISDGTESSSSITGMNGDDENNKRLVTFRANQAIVSVTPTDSGGENTNGDPAAVSANASAETAPLIILGFYCAAADVDPRTFTVGGSPAKDGEFGSGHAWIAWKIYISSPQDASIDMDDEGNLNTLAAGILEVS